MCTRPLMNKMILWVVVHLAHQSCYLVRLYVTSHAERYEKLQQNKAKNNLLLGTFVCDQSYGTIR